MDKVELRALFISKGEKNSEKVVELTASLVLARLSSISAELLNISENPSSENFTNFTSGENMEEYLKRIETYLLKNAMDSHNNNKSRAARELGISRGGLIKKLKRIGH